METSPPSNPRVIVPTPVRQQSPGVKNALPSVLPIASRTRAAQAAVTKFSQGPAGNTQSQLNIALERALNAASYLDNKIINVKHLAKWKFLPTIFTAALAVMDIDSGKMLKHWQLTNHQDQDISRTWNTLTADKIGRLFQGVGVIIKNPSNTYHFIRKEQVPENRFRDVTYGKFECIEHS